MESKRKNIYIVIFVITTIIASCVAVYFGFEAGKSKEESVNLKGELKSYQENVEKSSSNISESDKVKEEVIKEKIVEKYVFNPELDSSKCINPQEGANYQKRISYEFTPLACVINSDNRSAVLTTNWEQATKLWGFIPNGGNGIYEPRNVNNFGGEILDVIYTGWGQTADNSTLLFLMKDGSVEYIPIYNAYKTSNFKSYGRLNGVSDIVYIGNVSVYGQCTPIAMKADGSFYQLTSVLEKTGNYNF